MVRTKKMTAEEQAAAEVDEALDDASSEEEEEFDSQPSYLMNKKIIHGFSTVKKEKVYEILYMTKPFLSFRFTDKDQTDRVMLIQENFGEKDTFMVYAPCSIDYKKVFKLIKETVAYFKSYGQKISKNENRYFDVKVKALDISGHKTPTREELIERATKVFKAIEAEKAREKEMEEFANEIDEIDKIAAKNLSEAKKKKHRKTLRDHNENKAFIAHFCVIPANFSCCFFSYF